MSDEKVIHAFKSADDIPPCPATVERDRMIYCQHQVIHLDTHDRSLSCSQCGATLDPFAFLLNYARSMERGWMDYRLVREKVRGMNESILRLQREEKRLKASIRRAKDKLPDTIDLRGGK